MDNTGGTRLTTLGRNLYALGITESVPIEITRIVVGDGELIGTWESLTDIINPLFEVSEISYRTRGEDIAEILFEYTSHTEPDGFIFREFGIFARHPAHGEILYAYENAGDYADHVAPASSFRFTKNLKRTLVQIANAANVVLHITLRNEVQLEHVIDSFVVADEQNTFPLVNTSPTGALSVIIEGAETLDYTVVNDSVVLSDALPAGVHVWVKEVKARDMSE